MDNHICLWLDICSELGHHQMGNSVYILLYGDEAGNCRWLRGYMCWYWCCVSGYTNDGVAPFVSRGASSAPLRDCPIM